MNNAMPTTSARSGVLLLSGYGIRAAVERGHLCVEDGVGADRRRARFSRADRKLRRLVVLGHAGTISFDALRWLSDVGAGFAQIDHDGRVIVAAGPTALQDARLRRAQALAFENGLGLEIARELAWEKLEGQRTVLDRLPDAEDARAALRGAVDRLDAASTIDQLRAIEAEGALAYWGAWAPVQVQFARRDAARIPVHWRTFGRRASLVTGASRKATNPANAILNYLYAIAEAEARLAALAVGCDPGLGLLHADQRSRDSLACDLMEPVRPVVDGWVLDLLANRTFRRSDFFETREGVCRIMPPLTRLLAETAPRWGAAVAPIAEWLVRQLLGERKDKKAGRRRRSSRAVPTPLTQANRSAGREKVRARTVRNARAKPASLPRTCVVCGSGLGRSRRRYCASCQAVQTLEAVSKAHEVLRRRRLAGGDPAHGGQAARRRGKRNAAALRANVAWERRQTDTFDPATFAEGIGPKLQAVSLAAMMRATGLSRPYCAMIRRGARVPHARHWEALRALVN
jgi:CRISPR-associated endonuclease Cas1